MDDHDFKSVRKAFNIVSVLILILAYSNAEINEINFLGIDITLEGEKVYVGIFVLYLYFVWRFLTKLPWKGGFQNDFNQYVIGLQQNSVKNKSKDKIESLSSNYFNGFNVTRVHNRSIRHLEFRWTFIDSSSGDVFIRYGSSASAFDSNKCPSCSQLVIRKRKVIDNGIIFFIRNRI